MSPSIWISPDLPNEDGQIIVSEMNHFKLKQFEKWSLLGAAFWLLTKHFNGARPEVDLGVTEKVISNKVMRHFHLVKGGVHAKWTWNYFHSLLDFIWTKILAALEEVCHSKLTFKEWGWRLFLQNESGMGKGGQLLLAINGLENS